MRAFSPGAFLCLAAVAVAQQVAPCPGGRVVTGFQLSVGAPGAAEQVPLAEMNHINAGETLRYEPFDLPTAWQHSGKVAVIAVPAANDASAQLSVFSADARQAAVWRMPTAEGALAFLFGPNGLNPKKTRSLLSQHPELVAHFTAYAAEASRVEALVALLARYEASPPGTLDLNTMLKEYSDEYGVTMPKANPNLPPDQEAAILLAAVAPPTAQEGPASHAELRAGGTSTATALASLYFGPMMGVATDTMPLFHALHQSLFPGTQFQGAFAQAGAEESRLCAANTAAPPDKHTVYIWMSDLPGGEAPTAKLAKSDTEVVAAGSQAKLHVTCGTVGELRDLARSRQWRLVAANGTATPVPVQVDDGPLEDTLALDLRQVELPVGNYTLAALWDWTPVTVQGTVAVRKVASLAGAMLDAGAEERLAAGNGSVSVTVVGADFEFVDKVTLNRPGTAALNVPFTLESGSGAETDKRRLTAQIDTSALAPGAYELRLQQEGGKARSLAVTILPPNPVLAPLRANLGEGAQQVTLHGEHLERIGRILSDAAQFTLTPVDDAQAGGLNVRQATVTLGPKAQAGEQLPVEIYVNGLPDPLQMKDEVEVLAPRPVIRNLTQSVNTGGTVQLLPGELPANATVNFAFHLDHAPAQPEVDLSCREPGEQAQAVALHPGQQNGTQELESGGDGLFYLAAVPGAIGTPGCDLQMAVADGTTGNSDPVELGRVVDLPRIGAFTLSNDSPGPGEFAGQLIGDNLQLIAATGWNPQRGMPVTAIPMRIETAGRAQMPSQTLAIVMPWPPPEPHAPLYIWLHGEKQGRKTTVRP